VNTALSLDLENPFSLRDHVHRLTPGGPIRLDGQAWRIRGTILATDHAESWIECLLEPQDPAVVTEPPSASLQHFWLAVEADQGRARFTLWRRSAVQAGPDPGKGAMRGIPLAESGRGQARYQATGNFGHIEVPPEGVLEYIEYAHAEGRAACERFAPHLPWLIGSGTGQALVAEAAG
jgi:hypothetical protein